MVSEKIILVDSSPSMVQFWKMIFPSQSAKAVSLYVQGFISGTEPRAGFSFWLEGKKARDFSNYWRDPYCVYANTSTSSGNPGELYELLPTVMQKLLPYPIYCQMPVDYVATK